MKIHKYVLNPPSGPKQYQTLSLHRSNQFLCINVQHSPVLYVLENDTNPKEDYLFVTYYTGLDVLDGQYLGTYTFSGLVYHVFKEFA